MHYKDKAVNVDSSLSHYLILFDFNSKFLLDCLFYLILLMGKWIGPIVKVSRLPAKFQLIKEKLLKICDNKVPNGRKWFPRFLFAVT